MKTKLSKKTVHAVAASLAPLRDEELTVVAGAGAPEKIHLMLKTGPGAPFILNAVIKS
jgi:hypothetical protein